MTHTSIMTTAFLLFFTMTPIGFAQSNEALPSSPVADPKASEKISLQLTIKEKGTGRLLRKVEVKYGNNTIFSGPKGDVIINDALGIKNISFKRFGFEKLIVPYSEVSGKKEATVYLFPSPPDDNEVRITGKKRPEISRITVSVEESIKVAPGGDPVQVAKLLPGVQPSASGGGAPFSSNAIIRGSGPEDSKYYIDDIPIPVIFHSIGNLSIVPDQMIKELEFSTGGFGPRYGNATGGAIVIKTKNSIPEERNLEVKVNLPIYSGIYYEAPLSNDSAISASYRRSYIQFFLPILLEQQEDIDIDVVPYFGDIHLQHIKVTDTGHSKLNIFNSHDGLQLAGAVDFSAEESGRANVDILNSFTALGYQIFRRLPNRWTVTTTPAVLFNDSNNEFFGNKIVQQSLGVSWVTEFIKRYNRTDKLYLGFDYSKVKSSYDLYVPRPSRSDPFLDFEEAPKIKLDSSQQSYQAAAWVSLDKKIGDFILSPGLRVFGSSGIKKTGYDPRLNTRYELSKDNFLKIAVGQYSKEPEGDELDSAFGNPDLDYEVSLHQILGWERAWSDKWTTDIQVFKKNLKNAIRDDSETTLNNKGAERITGAELFIRRNATARLFGWLSYTHAKNETRDDDQSSYQTSRYDQTNVLTLVANYKLNSTWNLGGRSTYSTGSPYTPVEDVVYNSNLDKYQRRTTSENQNSARLPDSTKLSLYATKDFLMNEWKMQLKFGVEEYVIGDDAINVGYNYDYSEQELTSGIPGIPYIEVRAKL